MHEEKYITHTKGHCITEVGTEMSLPERRYMNDLTGMTVEEFQLILNEMRTVYPFKDEETIFGTCYDPREERGTSRVEICTKDQDTGIYITMRKAGHRSE